MPDSAARIQRFTDFPARSRLTGTRQRDRIVRTFFAVGRHRSAEERSQRIQAQDPGIGLVTVSQTLKLLRGAGLAAVRQFGQPYARFDPPPADWPHDHLICRRCGTIQEFTATRLAAVREMVARSRGFTGTEHRVERYAFCRVGMRLNTGRADRRRNAARPHSRFTHAEPRARPTGADL